MGLLLSKPNQEPEIETSVPLNETLSIQTPKHKRILEILDPRSPSSNIIRTPIQLATSPLSLSAQNVSCDTFNINSPIPKSALTDPRSPTLAYARTPIVIKEDDEKLPKRLHNKNLDNVRKMALITPKKLADMPSQVPPKLLESSPIDKSKQKSKMTARRKSFVGFLETNLDYVETDLDAVFLSKSMSNLCEASKTPSKDQLKAKFLENSLHVFEEPKEESVEAANEETEVKNAFEDHILDNAVVVDKFKDVKEEIQEEITEEKLQITENVKKTEETADIVSIFDKKISNLIYTDLNVDDEKQITPVALKIPNEKDNGTVRTPLGTRNGNERVKKAIPRLKVRDKPRKSDYVVSKIPVFKPKIQGQCENTPPKQKNHSQGKSRRPQWDNDNTLVI